MLGGFFSSLSQYDKTAEAFSLLLFLSVLKILLHLETGQAGRLLWARQISSYFFFLNSFMPLVLPPSHRTSTPAR